MAQIKKQLKTEPIKTYTDAVDRGDYDIYHGNLFGKYDNVRTCWEDQLTRSAIKPYLIDLVSQKHMSKEKLRIIDLGCGAGQGYDLLTKIEKSDLALSFDHDWVLSEKDIELYLGLDLSPSMVKKGSKNYRHKTNVKFLQSDLSSGLAIKDSEKPFDIYFSSYGSFSHLSNEELKKLLIDIYKHGENGSLVVLDLLGRYSIEWPLYWAADKEEDKIRDYSMSYIYPDLDRASSNIEHFPIRFWTGDEIDNLIQCVLPDSGIKYSILKKFDRSILVGRHTDTREYNPAVKRIRRVVNSLFAQSMRTDLNALLIDPNLFPEHHIVSSFLNELIKSWNILIMLCQNRLTHQSIPLVELDNWSFYPAALQMSLMTMDRVIASSSWMWCGDPRANIIEPQLGYALRNLESGMQQGLGCGHSLLVVLRIVK